MTNDMIIAALVRIKHHHEFRQAYREISKVTVLGKDMAFLRECSTYIQDLMKEKFAEGRNIGRSEGIGWDAGKYHT